MKDYIKIYHYSSAPDLREIDPAYYGEGVTRGAECKYGKAGLNKSYFYIEDRPEVVVASGARRYEIYMPAAWRKLIYDRTQDPLNLYQAVIDEVRLREGRNPYQYELKDGVEAKIKEHGFVGWRVSASELPHVVVLFEKLSTKRPSGEYRAFDWNGNQLEVVRNAAAHARLFHHQVPLAGDDIYVMRPVKTGASIG